MRLLIFISILLSVMYATNPTTSNFSSFVADRISEKAREEGAKEDLSNLAGGIASMYVKKKCATHKLLCDLNLLFGYVTI